MTADPCDTPRPLGAWCACWPGLSDGRRLHRATIYRWSLHGRAGVRLRTVIVPGLGRCATPRDVREFIDAVTRACDANSSRGARVRRQPRPGAQPTQRRHRALERHGLSPEAPK